MWGLGCSIKGLGFGFSFGSLGLEVHGSFGLNKWRIQRITGLHTLRGQGPSGPSRGLHKPARNFKIFRVQGPPGNMGATAEDFVPWVWGIPIKGEINVNCIYLAHWGGWRQGCASPCTGRARRGSIRPFSIGSSHRLTQYGCNG